MSDRISSVLDGSALWSLSVGDCRDVLRAIPDSSVHSVVCDPPYELGFMGKRWDSSGIAYDVSMWAEVLRVLKPGGHLLAFGGTRTYHRMTCAIEDAGFDVRDCILWLYASGFPKSLNISKAIDAAEGAERKELGPGPYNGRRPRAVRETNIPGAEFGFDAGHVLTAPTTDAAKQWDGWGTALKPACEPCVLARKPMAETVAANVLEHGTGALNIDATRIAGSADDMAKLAAGVEAIRARGGVMANSWKNSSDLSGANPAHEGGRWPANVLHDGSPEVLDAFAQFGERDSGIAVMRNGGGRRIWGSDNTNGPQPDEGYADSGTAARFFFCAKASRAERELGCEYLPAATGAEAVGREEDSAGVNNPRAGAGRTANAIRNTHPTVKPLSLLRYLCRLVTPPNGIVLDPFAGSGSCGMAALLERFRYIGIELGEHHARIARARIRHVDGYGGPAEDDEPAVAKQMALFGVGT